MTLLLILGLGVAIGTMVLSRTSRVARSGSRSRAGPGGLSSMVAASCARSRGAGGIARGSSSVAITAVAASSAAAAFGAESLLVAFLVAFEAFQVFSFTEVSSKIC